MEDAELEVGRAKSPLARLNFALAQARLYAPLRGPYPLLDGAEKPRLYEVALVLALREAPELPFECKDIRLQLVGEPSSKVVRQHLEHLEQLGLVKHLAAGRFVLMGRRDEISPGVEALREALERHQRNFWESLRAAKGKARESSQQALQEIERALDREDAAEGIRLAETRAGELTFFTRLLRLISTRERPEVRLEALSRAGSLATDRMRLPEARLFLARASEEINAGSAKPGLWSVRLKETEARIERMDALLVVGDERRERAIWKSLDHHRAAYACALTLDTAQPEAVPTDLKAQIAYKRLASLAILIALTRRRQEWAVHQNLIREAEGALLFAGPLRSLGKGYDACHAHLHLMEMRLALALSDLPRARKSFREAEAVHDLEAVGEDKAQLLLAHADLALAQGATPSELRQDYEEIWKTSAPWSFERLLVLARVGVFEIAPLREWGDERRFLYEEMRDLGEQVHHRRKGLAYQKCDTCRLTLPHYWERIFPERMRCTFELPQSEGRSIEDLWTAW